MAFDQFYTQGVYNRPPPTIGQRTTKAAVNNQIAVGDQQAAQRSYGGQGVSRGAGQQYMDSIRGGFARANAFGQAADTQAQDMNFNRGAIANYQNARNTEQLAYRDSRFNNLTSIWGALAGLLK